MASDQNPTPTPLTLLLPIRFPEDEAGMEAYKKAMGIDEIRDLNMDERGRPIFTPEYANLSTNTPEGAAALQSYLDKMTTTSQDAVIGQFWKNWESFTTIATSAKAMIELIVKSDGGRAIG